VQTARAAGVSSRLVWQGVFLEVSDVKMEEMSSFVGIASVSIISHDQIFETDQYPLSSKSDSS